MENGDYRQALVLFQAYLSNRQHFVCYKDASSTTLPVVSGVPQGSVLGPLLFLVYINDIPSSINVSSVFLFADDAKLLSILRSNLDSAHLQDNVDSIGTWSEEWKVRLNASKCAHTHFSMQGSVPSVKYRVNDSAIQCSSLHKDLGIIITQQMSWSTHINRVCSCVYHSLHVIKRNIPQNSSLALRKILYLTLVRSHLCYSSQLWRPHLFKDTNNMERVQRRATKLILQDFSDYKSRLISLNLLLVSMWLEQQDVLFMVKCLQSPSDNFDILNCFLFKI